MDKERLLGIYNRMCDLELGYTRYRLPQQLESILRICPKSNRYYDDIYQQEIDYYDHPSKSGYYGDHWQGDEPEKPYHMQHHIDDEYLKNVLFGDDNLTKSKLFDIAVRENPRLSLDHDIMTKIFEKLGTSQEINRQIKEEMDNLNLEMEPDSEEEEEDEKYKDILNFYPPHEL